MKTLAEVIAPHWTTMAADGASRVLWTPEDDQ